MKKIVALLCLALLLLPVLAGAEALQPDRAASLTLWLKDEGQPVPGAVFAIRRVAALDGAGCYTLLPGYSLPDGDINDTRGAAQWAALAETLAAKAGQADASAPTDSAGKAVFKALDTGLYLVTAEPAQIGGWVYEFAPFLVCTPGKTDGEWDYAPQADVKFTRTTPVKDLRIVKYWYDNGSTQGRPTAIEAEVYCDGALYATVTLNKENNWMYTLAGVESAHVWTVKEKTVPTGYEVSYSEVPDGLIIANTLKQKLPAQPDIPQTGLTWWPVPVLAVLGLVLILTGCLLRRKVSADE